MRDNTGQDIHEEHDDEGVEVVVASPLRLT
jgi:hypothetical protein